MQAIIDSILTINCENVKSSPQVSDAMPDDFINGTSKVYYLFELQLFIVILLILAFFTFETFDINPHNNSYVLFIPYIAV